MTEPADPSLRTLAELVARVTQTLRAGDDPAAREQAAADVDQLREVASAADRQRAPGVPAAFDVTRLTAALAVFADWLRAPTPAREAQAQQAMADLQLLFGPLLAPAAARDDAAQRDQYRQDARAAIDDYFRDNPIKPFKP
jgi:hypothetical protein